MPIYTRRGDTGLTSLLSGERVKKSDARVVAVGELDELSTLLGWAALTSTRRKAELKDFQQDIYRLSALIDLGNGTAKQSVQVSPDIVVKLENLIDAVQATLPRLGEFIFPGHAEASCRLHIARVIARRVERHLVRLPKQSTAIALPYVNRLSDLLFVLAREADHELQQPEQHLNQP